MWTVEEIRNFFEVKRGVHLQAMVNGPSDSKLLFYPWGRHHLIVQVWPHQGFDVHVNNLSPKIADTIEWLDGLLKA